VSRYTESAEIGLSLCFDRAEIVLRKGGAIREKGRRRGIQQLEIVFCSSGVLSGKSSLIPAIVVPKGATTMRQPCDKYQSGYPNSTLIEG
jgi:hypothetical protein